MKVDKQLTQKDHLMGRYSIVSNREEDRANTGRGGQRPDVVGKALEPRLVDCWFYTSSNASCRSRFANATDAFVLPPDARTGARRYGTGGGISCAPMAWCSSTSRWVNDSW